MVRHDERGPLPWTRVPFKIREITKRAVIDELAGVGQGNIRRDRSELVLHARRRLSEAELAAQSPEWHAIQAIDRAGDGIPW